MKKKLIMALVAAATGLITSASAETPLRLTRTLVDNGWEKVWMYCDQFGRCWKERGSINALLESYNYAPPPAATVREQRPGNPPGSMQVGDRTR